MPKKLIGPLALASAVVAAISLVQSFRSAEEAGRLEIQARGHEAERIAILRSAAEAAADRDRMRADVSRLERELDSALNWTQALGEALSAEAERREKAASEHASASALAVNPPPFGVQRVMLALRDCLRSNGYEGMQMLRASALEGHELRDVEFLSLDRETGRSELVVARSMSVRLDRAAQAIRLTFVGGHARTDGLRSEIPAEGKEIRLVGVDGRMWEQKLPYLLQAEGDYATTAAELRDTRRLDRESRDSWLERLDALLLDSGAELKLRVAGFVSLEEREFLSARLVGYDDRNLLALAADCDRLAFEIDTKAGIVSLRLRGGTLRRDGSESSIHADGLRMLLPNVTPERASMLLMGMVVKK
jgi:hypothetical protein